MSFNLEQVRKAYNDPILSKIAEFTKRIAKLETDNVEIETDDITGHGDSDRTKVLYSDYWNFIKKYGSYYDYITLDGVNDYVDCGNQTTLWSLPLAKFSFSFWIYPTAGWDGNVRDMIDHNGTSSQGFKCYINSSGSNTVFRVKDAINTSIEAFSTTLVLNRWNFIACIYDNSLGSANVKIYVDSVLGNTTANLTESVNRSAILTLANSSTDFQGRMRDFRWWTTKPLTQTEITRVMYNDPLAPTPDYWLKMNDGPTNPVDSISGTLTGTLTNGAAFLDRADPLVPFEPDYFKFALDLKFNMFGNTLEDYSGLNHHATIYGEPCPTIASEVFYMGGSKKNIGWKMSKSDRVHLEIPSTGYFEVINEQSWIFRLNFSNLSDIDPISGIARKQTLVEKYDSATDEYFIRVGADGNIYAGFKDGGVSATLRTSNAPIVVNRDYEIAVTYNSTGDVILFYVNGVVQPTTSTSESYDGSTSTTNVHLLASLIPSNSYGYCDLNYIDLIRYYDDTVLTAAQVANHYRNKLTISNIAEGNVAVADASVAG